MGRLALVLLNGLPKIANHQLSNKIIKLAEMQTSYASGFFKF